MVVPVILAILKTKTERGELDRKNSGKRSEEKIASAMVSQLRVGETSLTFENRMKLYIK